MTQKEYSFLFREYPDILCVRDVAKMLGISTKLVYRIIKEGKLHSVKIGRENKIPKIAVVKYLVSQEDNHFSKNNWTSENPCDIVCSAEKTKPILYQIRVVNE